MIASELLEALERLGRSGTPSVPELLRDPDEAWKSIMCGDRPWRDAAQKLDAGTLRAVIHGLVLYAQASGWSGGSVSPVITLFHTYEERFPGDTPALTEWVLTNRRNENEPFGHHVPLSATTVNDLTELRDARVRRATAAREKEDQQRRDDASRRAARATDLVLNAVRRGDVKAVVALLEKGADPSLVAPSGATLLTVAEENGHTDMAELLRSRGIR